MQTGRDRLTAVRHTMHHSILRLLLSPGQGQTTVYRLEQSSIDAFLRGDWIRWSLKAIESRFFRQIDLVLAIEAIWWLFSDPNRPLVRLRHDPLGARHSPNRPTS